MAAMSDNGVRRPLLLLTMEAEQGVQLYDLVRAEYHMLTPVTVQAQVEVA